jgi:hypothetical protein
VGKRRLEHRTSLVLRLRIPSLNVTVGDRICHPKIDSGLLTAGYPLKSPFVKEIYLDKESTLIKKEGCSQTAVLS